HNPKEGRDADDEHRGGWALFGFRHSGFGSYLAPSRRAQASTSRTWHSVGCDTTWCRSIARRTVSDICGKLIWRFTKASTAISLAAFKTAGMVPPASPALRARSSAGNLSGSGSSKVKLPSFARLVCTRSLGARSGYVSAY